MTRNAPLAFLAIGIGAIINIGGCASAPHRTDILEHPHGGVAPPDPRLAARKAHVAPGGMWLPSQMLLPQHLETLAAFGVVLDRAALADPLAAPLAAVVSLGGCTASFVSAEGLIVTNHHCVQGALQLNSTPEANLVENGFLAKTKADEKSAGPAQRVMIAQAFTDVTAQMRGGLEAIADPVARKDESEKRQKQLVATCEKDRPGIRCQVSGFFRGASYLLIEMLELRDVRLVYVPARAVGNYGGEVDNWAWPRHTGDFSFYRAYVGKDGKPADFAADNVPYQPKHWLKVSSAGLAPSDFVMVTGYPGSTQRTVTATEIHQQVAWYYPYLITYMKERYAIAEAHLGSAGETAIKATLAKQGIQNGLEKFEGVLKGLTSGDLVQRKDAIDADIKAYAAEPGHEATQAALTKLEGILAESEKTARVDFDRSVAFSGSRLLATALSLTRWAEERQKPDAERKPGYQDRDLSRAKGAQKTFAKQYDRTLDRANFRMALVRALQLPANDRPWLADLLGVKRDKKVNAALIDKTLAAWYAAPLIEDEALRLALLEKGTSQEIAASRDPFVQAAQRIWKTFKSEERKTDARTGELLLLTPFYSDAMREVLGGFLSPDANSTLRITYGTVRSFKPDSQELVDQPFTVAAQIPLKNTGAAPFNAPEKLLSAIAAKAYCGYGDPALGGEIAIDFLSDLDITGGNSGSPTLNDKGELVGLAFDGDIEGVASDVMFDARTTRTIHVDARYMLWTMEALDGAAHLVSEMGVPLRCTATPAPASGAK